MTTTKPLTREELRQRAAAWLGRELQRAEQGHGARWAVNAAWVKDYLAELLRQRLEALNGRA